MKGNICIITARGGSTRIPRKNIRPFFGYPIISYPIKVALESKLFDEVMVSTDDEEIAQIAKQYGAKVPFMRSKKNSDNYAGTADVLLEVLEEYQKRGKTFQNVCCIYPTNPFVNIEDLKSTYDLLKSKNFDSVLPVIEYRQCIQKSLRIQQGRISPTSPEHRKVRSQDLEKLYYDAGEFYWLDVNKFLTNKEIITDNTGFIVKSEMAAQDIDVEEDWKLMELKYKLLRS